MSADSFGCHNSGWGGGRGRMLLLYIREQPGMPLNILQCTKQHSTTKQYWIQHVSSAEVEKSWLAVIKKEDMLQARTNRVAAPRLLTGLRARFSPVSHCSGLVSPYPSS